MPEYPRLFEELTLPVAMKHLEPPIGFYTSQIGPLNQVVHLWGFDSLDAMQRGRQVLATDPDFAKYLELITGLVAEQLRYFNAAMAKSFKRTMNGRSVVVR
jgi:hypothetical protein